MREHGALRPTRGSRCVEQPGEIVARARRDADGVGRKQCLVIGAADRDQPLERFRRVWRDLRVESGRSKADARAGMFEDKAELGAVQLGIGRHRGKPGVPDAEQQFDIVVRILGDDGDALAGLELEPIAQRAGKPRGAAGELRRRSRPRACPLAAAGSAGWPRPARSSHNARFMTLTRHSGMARRARPGIHNSAALGLWIPGSRRFARAPE